MQTAISIPCTARTQVRLATRPYRSFDLLRAPLHRTCLPRMRRHVAALPARFSAKACDGGTMPC